MHKNATKCNETLSKWCKNKHGASKIIDAFETYHLSSEKTEAATREDTTVDPEVSTPTDPFGAGNPVVSAVPGETITKDPGEVVGSADRPASLADSPASSGPLAKRRQSARATCGANTLVRSYRAERCDPDADCSAGA
jgi:hypothetical protein